jgi:hypothetical protein
MSISNTITIESVNYSGESSSIIFRPSGDTVSINLGTQTLPYVFDPSILEPPKTIYGQYIITTSTGNCSYNLFVVE